MEEVGPAPDITRILALLEQYQAPRHGPGLPGGDATFEELEYAARHFPPGSWSLPPPGPFPLGPHDPPVATMAPAAFSTANAADVAVASSPAPSASASSFANAAEVAKVKAMVIPSSESAPGDHRRRRRLVRNLARKFRGLFSRNRKPNASS